MCALSFRPSTGYDIPLAMFLAAHTSQTSSFVNLAEWRGVPASWAGIETDAFDSWIIERNLR